jgi:hypothetical protein
LNCEIVDPWALPQDDVSRVILNQIRIPDHEAQPQRDCHAGPRAHVTLAALSTFAIRSAFATLSVFATLSTLACTATAQDQLLWGDTHLHSSNSTDAYLFGNMTADPETSYRFARGLPVVHPGHRARGRSIRPSISW